MEFLISIKSIQKKEIFMEKTGLLFTKNYQLICKG